MFFSRRKKKDKQENKEFIELDENYVPENLRGESSDAEVPSLRAYDEREDSDANVNESVAVVEPGDVDLFDNRDNKEDILSFIRHAVKISARWILCGSSGNGVYINEEVSYYLSINWDLPPSKCIALIQDLSKDEEVIAAIDKAKKEVESIVKMEVNVHFGRC